MLWCLASMEKVEPFDLAPQDKADLKAWERKTWKCTIAKLGKGIEAGFTSSDEGLFS